MTALANIQRQRYIPLSHKKSAIGFEVFDMLQNNRFLTRAMTAWIMGAILTYLVAIYSLFGLNVTIQQKSVLLKDLTEANIINELSLQQRHTEFARGGGDIVQSMEKISDMRYVMPVDTVVSRIHTSDKTNQ